MAAAGASAGTEARRLRARSESHAREAANDAAQAARYEVAEITEKRVARELSVLTAWGYHLLPDRGWPGSRSANVDLIVVGPAGVFIVDTKAWADASIHDGRIFRDQADVSDDLANLADLARNTDGVLADCGLAPGEVHAIAVLAGRRNVRERVGPVEIIGELDSARYILRMGDRLSTGQVDVILKALIDLFPSIRPIDAIDITIPSRVLAAVPNCEPEEEPEPMFSAEGVKAAALEGVLAEPIETWMSFLDPAQAKLARRTFSGPSRIRGSAGTGKTVVGLHRASYLARSGGGRVLFATYTKSLPGVFANLLATMSPDLVDRVEFTGIHAFAMRLLRERGIRHRIDAAEAAKAFDEAWAGQSKDGPLASKNGVTSRYWREEIDHVIKGRGITRFDQYADLSRIGRRYRLSLEQRRAVWHLYEAYESGLRHRGVQDFADVILLALSSLRAKSLDAYSSVIVDEAQDLSCAMVALLYSLVGNRTDGLTLIGDGQQSIYPGGYALSELGISLAGRGVVLSVNHRNTSEILNFANSMVAGDEFTDIEGTSSLQDRADRVTRSGPDPHVDRFPYRAAHDAAVVEYVRAAAARVGTSLGDLAVLTHKVVDAAGLRAVLEAAGIAAIDLAAYDGRPVDAVKVGTIKRSKGLEFKEVLIGRIPSKLFGPPSVAQTEVMRERWSLDRRELYVAMTRARDRLWLGLL